MAKVSVKEKNLRKIVAESVNNTLMEMLENNPELEEGLFGGRLANSFNQHYNSLKSGYYDNKAGNMAAKIKQQIGAAEQIMQQQQAKIQALRSQYNTYVNKSQTALNNANAAASANGKGQGGDYEEGAGKPTSLDVG